MSPVKEPKKKANPTPTAPSPASLPEYRITPGAWMRMMKTLDILTGNRAARAFRAAMWILGLLLAAYIVFLAVLIIVSGRAVTPEESTGMARFLQEHSAGQAENVLGLLLNLFTVAFTGVTALQIYLMKDIDHQEMSHQVFQDNQEHRRDSDDARYQLELLATELKQLNSPDPASFNSAYVRDAYKDLRAFAFHHEYIGHLVYRNRLNFGITFDTITFPNWLITSDDAKVVIHAGRTAFSDFWMGSYHLYLTYEVRRKYNALYFARREKHRNRQTVAKCRADFHEMCRQWKQHYRIMPPK